MRTKLIFLFLAIVLLLAACQPPQGVRRGRMEASTAADSVLYYQPKPVNDPFLDSLKAGYGQDARLTVTVLPPPPPPAPTHKQIDGFRVQVFAGIDSLNAAAIKSQVAASVDDSVYLLRQDALYKVQAGDFPYRPGADMMVMDMRKIGFDKAWVVATQINIPIQADSASAKPQAGMQNTGRYSIQLLASSDSLKAKTLVSQWQSAAASNAFYKRDGQLYKVFVGPFTTREEAEAELKNVRATGYPDAWIVEQQP